MMPDDVKAAWLRHCESEFLDDAVAAEELANDEGCRDLFAAGAKAAQEKHFGRTEGTSMDVRVYGVSIPDECPFEDRRWCKVLQSMCGFACKAVCACPLRKGVVLVRARS